MSHHDGTCLSSGGGSSTLRVHSSPANAAYTNFSFSPLPPSSNATFYRYALAKAMLALAPGCTTMLASHLGAPNADNGPGTARNLWVGRVDELDLQLDQSVAEGPTDAHSNEGGHRRRQVFLARPRPDERRRKQHPGKNLPTTVPTLVGM